MWTVVVAGPLNDSNRPVSAVAVVAEVVAMIAVVEAAVVPNLVPKVPNVAAAVEAGAREADHRRPASRQALAVRRSSSTCSFPDRSRTGRQNGIGTNYLGLSGE